jgi:hypothetical protein
MLEESQEAIKNGQSRDKKKMLDIIKNKEGKINNLLMVLRTRNKGT